MYSPEFYIGMPGCGLLNALDEMVDSGDFSNYHLLREYLKEKLYRSDHGNPFGAGRPPSYDTDDEDMVVQMKLQEHKTNREIAQIMHCSASTVCRLYNHGVNRIRQKM